MTRVLRSWRPKANMPVGQVGQSVPSAGTQQAVARRGADRVVTPLRAGATGALAATRLWLARPDVRAALVATLGLRLFCSAVAAAVPLLLPELYPWLSPYQPNHLHHATYPPGTPNPLYRPLDYLTLPWDRWDTAWYVDIARHGFVGYGDTAFLPLYPLLIRMSAPLVGGDLLGAALLVATVATFFTMLALYRLSERLMPGRGLGPYALLIAALLPTSFFLVAGYTESLFLALALWAILEALERRWWQVAALTGLAALTRQQGVLLAVLALPAAWAWVRWLLARMSPARASVDPKMPAWHLLVACATPVLAYGAWLGVVRFWLRAPMPWDVLAAASGWNLRLTWPGSALWLDVAALPGHSWLGPAALVQSTALDLFASLAAACALIVYARRIPVELTGYLIALWVTSLMKVLPSGVTVSEGRYMLQLLPLVVFPAGWLARARPLPRLVWVAVGVVGLVLYLWVFVLWGWVA